jgi:hypothetical protein
MRIGKMICVRKKAKKDNSFSVSFCDPLTIIRKWEEESNS